MPHGSTTSSGASSSSATGAQMPATVTATSPLSVRIDGASTTCPAKVLDGATYALGARVTVTVRNPLPPLVNGVES